MARTVITPQAEALMRQLPPGLSARQIAAALTEAGCPCSHMAVRRHLSRTAAGPTVPPTPATQARHSGLSDTEDPAAVLAAADAALARDEDPPGLEKILRDASTLLNVWRDRAVHAPTAARTWLSLVAKAVDLGERIAALSPAEGCPRCRHINDALAPAARAELLERARQAAARHADHSQELVDLRKDNMYLRQSVARLLDEKLGPERGVRR